MVPGDGGGGPQYQVWWFTRRTHRSQHIVRLTVEIYYNEEMKSKISEGKGARGKVWGQPSTSFQESSPSRITQDTLHSSRKLWQRVKRCLLGRFAWTFKSRVFIGGWSHIPKSQTHRRKAGIRRQLYYLYTDTSGTVNQSGNGGNASEFQFPRRQPRANLTSRPVRGRAVSGLVNSVLHTCAGLDQVDSGASWIMMETVLPSDLPGVMSADTSLKIVLWPRQGMLLMK